ncbi:TOTE conflict system archaeo-eukaryotic primase domain-containing protein [Paenibacillus fonticola]|uniref:TOTE conflict system archaeo-eukaryotic primase domain-containing protein n=1 Tax=Paenibacillus fonticola TaxID=379896 RepID=UPI00036B2620|nr:replication/maintenance protein RepL [Paenibacillus fonticola]
MLQKIEQQIQAQKEALLQQLNKLVIGERTRFIEQYGEGEQARYCTSTKKLVDSTVKSHLTGKRTVGCYYIGQASKFLCFDVDEHDPSIPLHLLQLLKAAGFKAEDLHIEYSGSKGWHIWMFFEETVPISKLVSFGKYIIQQLGDKGRKIELRPEQKENSRGIKLPFAIHRKSMVRTTFLQHDLQPIEDAVAYFLNIQPISKEQVQFLSNTRLDDDERLQKSDLTIGRSKQSIEVSATQLVPSAKKADLNSTALSVAAQKLLEDGIPQYDAEQQKGRHYYQFIIALHYKEQGLTESETIEKVTEWALRERRMNRSKSSEQEIKRDVATDVHHIYIKDKKFFAARAREVVFYAEDIRTIQEMYDPVLQQVAWAIIILGRMYHENGQVYFSIRQLEDMTGISRNTVHRRVIALRESGFLELIQNGYYKMEKSIASLYKVPTLLNQDASEQFSILVQSTKWDEIYEEALVQLYKHYMIFEMQLEKVQ